MLAPEDDIQLDKNEVKYDNLTYRKFEFILEKFKTFEKLSMFLFLILIFMNVSISYLLYQFIGYTQTSFEWHDEILLFFGNVSWTLMVFILMFICCYQVYKSLINIGDKHKIGFRFYFFQSFKVILLTLPMLNIFFLFALIALLRIVLITYYARSKSFK